MLDTEVETELVIDPLVETDELELRVDVVETIEEDAVS